MYTSCDYVSVKVFPQISYAKLMNEVVASLEETMNPPMTWTDQVRHLKVMTNAYTPNDSLIARMNGAQGIGLCRSEHMIFFYITFLVYKYSKDFPFGTAINNNIIKFLAYQATRDQLMESGMDGRCYNDLSLLLYGAPDDRRLMSNLRRFGVWMDGIELESHFDVPHLPLMRAIIDKFANLQLSIWLTEVDISNGLPTIDDDAIRQSYRKLILSLHPDKNKSVGAEGTFKFVSQASIEIDQWVDPTWYDPYGSGYGYGFPYGGAPVHARLPLEVLAGAYKRIETSES